ncbi:WecB/TagA/CpsF family glycosyltransferase [Celeribacter sp.]|uniref:WecB/TagA/CpsF family glycosyltransferase n=1 Tax=Celeribacter sp. TaxID=1890673 RepID=UPI003A8EFB43
MRELFDFQPDQSIDLASRWHPERPSVPSVAFMGMNFSIASQDTWMSLICAGDRSGFSYVATPNVDHMVQLDRRPELREAYDAADHRICDSRILEKLAAQNEIDLAPFAGSDITRALIEKATLDGPRIAVCGPILDDFKTLEGLYPNALLTHIETPMMTRGSAEWAATLERVEETEFDVLLICISFPKQELFAYDLKQRGKARGIGLCVGASIDFLTGKQKRAPEMFRAARMEWAYRLMSNPVRLWRRYLVDGPRVFALYWSYRRAQVKAAQAARNAAAASGSL